MSIAVCVCVLNDWCPSTRVCGVSVTLSMCLFSWTLYGQVASDFRPHPFPHSFRTCKDRQTLYIYTYYIYINIWIYIPGRYVYIYKYNSDEAVYHTKLKLKATECTHTGGVVVCVCWRIHRWQVLLATWFGRWANRPWQNTVVAVRAKFLIILFILWILHPLFAVL